MIEGFDASGWTGSIDFQGAKNAGKQYGIYRVGRGIPDGATNSQGIDLRWFGNKFGSIGAGLPTGGYWRFFPNVNMVTQVERFALALGQTSGMLSPWVDIEDTGGLSPSALTDWAIQCLTLVESRTGRRPILYTGKNFYDNNFEYQRLSNWELAIAWQTTGKWREYGSCFWQYLLDTPVSWAQGRVDLQKYAFNSLVPNLTQNELRYQIDEDGMFHGPMVWNEKLLPESGRQGTQSNQVAIVHTMVGYLNGTDSYFRRGDITLESHLGIGSQYDGVTLDGAIYQWMRTGERADANYQANAYAMSIETSDGGGNRYLEKWSPMQAESIAQCLAAWCLFYDQPAQLVNRSHSSVPGIGHHRIGTVPYPRPGDDYWSPPEVGPRACPGQPRIDQLTFETIPRIRDILSSLNRAPGGPDPEPEPPEEEGMQLTDVVMMSPDGQPVTVADCLRISVELKSMLGNMTDKQKEEFRALTDLVYTQSDQLTWGELATTTWCELANRRWGDLRPATTV